MFLSLSPTNLPSESFSPHTRGCSATPHMRNITGQVFPAYAGMFLPHNPSLDHLCSFPRIRGDVPGLSPGQRFGFWFSPHTRGCSEDSQRCSRRWGVFPAYAGMFLRCGVLWNPPPSFPRIRGDVPLRIFMASTLVGFSPHTRGCSEFVKLGLETPTVFPAYAGMFR